MTTVSIAIARDPALVRTVRLVAAAVVRRAAVDETLIEEVRLAVGEACAVMIGPMPTQARHVGADQSSDGEQVHVKLSVDRGIGATVEGRVADLSLDVDGIDLTPWALLRGLSEDVTVEEDGGTTRVTMFWPGG